MIIGVSPRSEDHDGERVQEKQPHQHPGQRLGRRAAVVPPRQMSLEQCLEFLADDELLEVTPKSLRMRKSILDHEEAA